MGIQKTTPSKTVKSSDDQRSMMWFEDLKFNESFHPGRRLSLSVFNSQLYIHIREFFMVKDVEMPTKRGVALNMDTLKMLRSNFQGVDNTLRQLEMGATSEIVHEDGTVYREHLGAAIYLTINKRMGGVDIRKFYKPQNSLSIAATKTGIFIPKSQWTVLKDRINELYNKYPKLDYIDMCIFNHQNQEAFLECSQCCPFRNLD